MMDEVSDHLVDMDLRPITLRQWAEMRKAPEAVLAEEEVSQPTGPRTSVKTIWTGDYVPQMQMWPFGTAVGGPGTWDEVATWRTKQEALEGHRSVVQALKEGRKP